MLKEPKYGVTFVYDGTLNPLIPPTMGEPRRDHAKKGDQAVGSRHEIVVELAGRACYDSLGKGRSSEDYHQHIREVNHNSVWGHVYHHFDLIGDRTHTLAGCLVNEPGIVITSPDYQSPIIFITINVRALVYQAARLRYLAEKERGPFSALQVIESMVRQAAKVDPQLLDWIPTKYETVSENEDSYTVSDNEDGYINIPIHQLPGVERRPFTAEEAVCHAAEVRLGGDWTIDEVMEDPERKEFLAHGYTVWYLEGFSRGWSHEHVRHTKEIGISQRSTRYVDESDSDWAWHPLIRQYLEDSTTNSTLDDMLTNAEEICRGVYEAGVPILQKYIQQRQPDIDKTTARKQARGAMRGVLGNALPTSMMWSVSLSELLFHYMPQRHSRYADAEIRVFANMLGEHLQERYPAIFSHLDKQESPDGLADEWTGWNEPLSHNNPYPEWEQ